VLSIRPAPVGGSPLGGELRPVPVTPMQYVDPPAPNVFFDEIRPGFKNQFSCDRITSIFRVLVPRFLTAKLIRPSVFIAVVIAGIVYADSVIRDILEKKTIADVEAKAVTIIREGTAQSVKEPMDSDKFPR
jgi:hypothetical protein